MDSPAPAGVVVQLQALCYTGGATTVPAEVHSPTFKLADAILFDGVPQPWELPEHSFEGAPIASMICAHERRFLHYLARHRYTGAGAVVDLGPLFGSSTDALLSGMSSGCVHSYDLWRFFPACESLLGKSLPVGSDVYPLFKENVSRFGDRVAPHKGDLLQYRWTGGPIEILFIDAAKSPELMLHIANAFFPSLIPGAFVIHQDWVSSGTPWIEIAMGLLADFFEIMDSPEGGTVCFRVKRRIPPRLLTSRYLADPRAAGCLDRAANFLSPRYALCVRLAEAHYWILRGDRQRALAVWKLVQGHKEYTSEFHGYDVALVGQLLARKRLWRLPGRTMIKFYTEGER